MNFALYVTGLRDAIRRKHGCESVHLRSEPVELSENEAVVWSGTVECFALLDCDVASQCYGWGLPADENAAEYVVVLHVGRVDSARRAVELWMGGRGVRTGGGLFAEQFAALSTAAAVSRGAFGQDSRLG